MKKIFMLTAIASFSLFLSACATTNRWEDETIIDQQFAKISIEHRTGQSDRQFNHPAELDPNLIEAILSDLFYPTKAALIGKAAEEPIFQDEEIERLAPAISMALEKADSHERIRFTSFNKGGGLIFEDHRETKGIIFVDLQDKINVAFSTINQPIEIEDTSGLINFSEAGDPLDIKKSHTRVIPKSDYIGNHRTSAGVEYPLWIEADLGNLKEKISQKAVPEKQKFSPTHDTRDLQEDEVKTKLRYLKELYEEDLITKEEYQAQKKDLLNSIK